MGWKTIEPSPMAKWIGISFCWMNPTTTKLLGPPSNKLALSTSKRMKVSIFEVQTWLKPIVWNTLVLLPQEDSQIIRLSSLGCLTGTNLEQQWVPIHICSFRWVGGVQRRSCRRRSWRTPSPASAPRTHRRHEHWPWPGTFSTTSELHGGPVNNHSYQITC